jgi:hypothetical protein
LGRLKETLYKKLPYISSNSETARREILVAPVLLELLDYVEANIEIEYPLYLNEQLKGDINYFRSRGVFHLYLKIRDSVFLSEKCHRNDSISSIDLRNMPEMTSRVRDWITDKVSILSLSKATHRKIQLDSEGKRSVTLMRQ